MKELSAERLAILKEYGFTDRPDCDLSWSFPAPSYAMDTNIFVEGDHATDRAYIYYACVENSDGNKLDGLFYSPSLLEYLLLDFGSEWRFEPLLNRLRKQLSCEVQFVFVGAYPNLFIEIDEYDWKEADIRFQVSDMLKLIGQLDYHLPRKWKALLAKRRKS